MKSVMILSLLVMLSGCASKTLYSPPPTTLPCDSSVNPGCEFPDRPGEPPR